MNIEEQLDMILHGVKTSYCEHDNVDFDKDLDRLFCMDCGKDITDEVDDPGALMAESDMAEAESLKDEAHE